MAINVRRHAWVLGAVGSMLVFSFVIYAIKNDVIQTPWSIAGGVGAALVGIWIWADRGDLQRTLTSRGARYSAVAIAMTLVAGCIAVALNLIAHRYDKRWDVTSSHRFAIAEQSIKVLQGLDQEVQITAFFPTGSAEEAQFKDLLEGFEQYTTLLKVRTLDPVRDPLEAERFEITAALGTVVLTAGESKQRLESEFGEEALTNALIRVTAGRKHVVCTTDGHGELDPQDQSGGDAVSTAMIKLEGQNYEVRTITLLREGGVPPDCEVLLSADPQVDWLPPEREMVAAYIQRGGAFVLLLDPGHAPNLAADMTRFGIDIGDDIVLESNPNYQLVGGDITYLLADQRSFDPHPITDPISGVVLFRVARSVHRTEKPVEGIDVQELIRTSEFAWGETKMGGFTPPTPDLGEDLIGRVALMTVAEITDPTAITVGSTSMESLGNSQRIPSVIQDVTGGFSRDPATEDAAADAPPTPPTPDAAEDARAGGRVVVIGDSDFATNALLDQGNNLDLTLNTIAWLVGEENQVSIRPNEAAQGTLTMNAIQGLLVWLISLLVAPGLTAVGAFATWRYRRSR